MTPQDFKNLIDEAIKKGIDAGLSEEEIFCELLEQVRFMTIRENLRVLSKAHHP